MTKINRSAAYPGPVRPGYAADQFRGGKATWPGHSPPTRLTGRALAATDGRSFGRGGYAAMRCMACGAQMRLVRVVRDDTMMVTGYEHHTLQCTECTEVERRLVFSREGTPLPVEPVPTPAAASAPPASPPPDVAALVAALPATPRVAAEPEPSFASAVSAAAPPAAAPEAAAPTSAEHAVSPTTNSATVASAAEPASLIIEPPSPPAEPVPAPSVPEPAATTDSDEGEILLLRAIEMVRSPKRRSLVSGGIAGGTPGAPAAAVGSVHGKKAPGRIVQIQRAPDDEAYIALDTKSGLSVLRHQDSGRLRAMCDRIGWQVVDG